MGVRVSGVGNDETNRSERAIDEREDMEEQELKDRLNLIESMIAEGRRDDGELGLDRLCCGAWPITSRLRGRRGATASVAWPVTMIVGCVADAESWRRA